MAILPRWTGGHAWQSLLPAQWRLLTAQWKCWLRGGKGASSQQPTPCSPMPSLVSNKQPANAMDFQPKTKQPNKIRYGTAECKGVACKGASVGWHPRPVLRTNWLRMLLLQWGLMGCKSSNAQAHLLSERVLDRPNIRQQPVLIDPGQHGHRHPRGRAVVQIHGELRRVEIQDRAILGGHCVVQLAWHLAWEMGCVCRALWPEWRI